MGCYQFAVTIYPTRVGLFMAGGCQRLPEPMVVFGFIGFQCKHCQCGNYFPAVDRFGWSNGRKSCPRGGKIKYRNMSFGTDHTVNGLESFIIPHMSAPRICKHGLIPKTTPPNNEIRSISTGGPKKSRQREIKHVTSIRHWCLRIR